MSRPDIRIARPHHGCVSSHSRNDRGDHVANGPRVYVIPVTFGGVRGAITARFIDFRPFHSAASSNGEQ